MNSEFFFQAGLENTNSAFTRELLKWHLRNNDRALPWKNEQDPYRIWLSEIILQQTRAEQGLPYYLSFVETYPDIQSLAVAKDEDVFRLWQGLGYYNRCRNMLSTARYIVNERNGVFPSEYNEILQLKGIGPYTAAAIASFAFGLPHAVVDGNVYRVLARYFGLETPIDSTAGKKQFQSMANDLLDHTDSAGYNQAIMDFGATVCVPAKPRCSDCPLRLNCFAFQQGVIELLPVKEKRLTVKSRYFHYILLQVGDSIWIHRRNDKDIWRELHEPFLIEHTQVLEASDLVQSEMYKQLGLSPNLTPEFLGSAKQRLTHQLIETRFYRLLLPSRESVNLSSDGYWVTVSDLESKAFPKTLVSFFKKIAF